MQGGFKNFDPHVRSPFFPKSYSFVVFVFVGDFVDVFWDPMESSFPMEKKHQILREYVFFVFFPGTLFSANLRFLRDSHRIPISSYGISMNGSWMHWRS